ncbi:MAG: protein kinase [Candidatus Aminicenantes bacterium]|nr:protein kinase [Candidatus Aminicenantes bacterium]NIM79711.1 protein kinase [Candidatus Aminicenantes bacterium]NIN17760.1 protein kinase [Candidatus Aminicenantes bacterium]NIN41661.1 protein kinase [Candidatus Aminicenantes bacterium]NIN84410.1 protein kinase [Candidatus Aminicenantes bacterium]
MGIDSVKQYLANKYEFIEPIGKGGFAEVYLAKDKLLERKVAVKILLSQFANEPDTVKRFIREARLYARMDHKNLIPVYDIGIIEDKEKNAFIIMKYIKGESLRTRQEREGKLPIDMIRTVIKEIASALEYIHSQGIIHRDIKPGNILTEEGTQNLYLADFGIARADTGDTLTQSGLIVGTPNYISPEQIKGKRIDSRADLYAFGATLYELITGKPIFTGDSSMQILYKHVNEEPEPLDSHMPNLPREIQYIVTRCLEKDPDKRFQTGGEILEILDSKRATFISRYLQARKKALQQKTGKRKNVIGKIAAIFLLVVITAAVVLLLNKEKGVEVISKKEESPQKTRAKPPLKTEEQLPTKSKTEIVIEDKDTQDKKDKETPSVQEKQKPPVGLKKEKETKEKIKPKSREEQKMQPPQQGTVRFSSYPIIMPAEVYLNDIMIGKTGQVFDKHFDPGEYTFTFKIPGYEEIKQKVIVKTGEESIAHVKFKPYGLVTITALPFARFFIDGKDYGTDPLYEIKLPEGEYTVKAVKKGYKTEEKKIKVEFKKTVTLSFTLEKVKKEEKHDTHNP